MPVGASLIWRCCPCPTYNSAHTCAVLFSIPNPFSAPKSAGMCVLWRPLPGRHNTPRHNTHIPALFGVCLGRFEGIAEDQENRTKCAAAIRGSCPSWLGQEVTCRSASSDFLEWPVCGGPQHSVWRLAGSGRAQCTPRRNFAPISSSSENITERAR